MSIKPALRASYRQLKLTRGRFGARPTCVVYGNCQAAGIFQHLNRCEDFPYRLVWIPSAHEIRASELPTIRKIVSRTDLFITQQIRSGYRGLPIGNSDFEALLPIGARIVRYPVVFYEGIYPYQVYINPGYELSPSAPITEYNDLRVIASKFQGFSVEDTIALIEKFSPAEDAIRSIHQDSVTELKRREDELDIEISDTVSSLKTKSVHTINHPSNQVLRIVTQRILNRLNLEYEVPEIDREILGSIISPLEAPVLSALGQPGPSTEMWTVRDAKYSQAQIVQAHISWLDARPEIVRAGMAKYRGRIESLGLLEGDASS